MVSTKIFKNFNIRIFCNKIYAQELIFWILNKYTKAFYNSYLNNYSVFLAQISSSKDINCINVLHVYKKNPCSNLKNNSFSDFELLLCIPYNSTSIPCIISVTECAKNSLWIFFSNPPFKTLFKSYLAIILVVPLTMARKFLFPKQFITISNMD
jgi:hypothetical protein